MKYHANPLFSELAVREWRVPWWRITAAARLDLDGVLAHIGRSNPTASSRRVHDAERLRRSQMKNDVDDIPIIYLFYVLLTVLAFVVIAAVLIFRFIKP